MDCYFSRTRSAKRQMCRILLCLGVLAGLGVVSVPAAALSEDASDKMVLTQAVMCEGIENYKPVNPGVVFSISQGEVFCFSSFDPVRETTRVFHKWYKKDRLIFTMPLTLSPPKWASFSRIQIRDADKGPWRVEIWDENNQIIKTLRFSMTD